MSHQEELGVSSGGITPSHQEGYAVSSGGIGFLIRRDMMIHQGEEGVSSGGRGHLIRWTKGEQHCIDYAVLFYSTLMHEI